MTDKKTFTIDLKIEIDAPEDAESHDIVLAIKNRLAGEGKLPIIKVIRMNTQLKRRLSR